MSNLFVLVYLLKKLFGIIMVELSKNYAHPLECFKKLSYKISTFKKYY